MKKPPIIVSLLTSSDIRSRQKLNETEKDRDFWMGMAENLQERLDSLFEALDTNGSATLVQQGRRITVFTEAAVKAGEAAA